MDIQNVLKELDQLFASKEIQKVEPFLLQKMDQAKEEQDQQSLITLLNESIGFYRDTSQYEKAISCCVEVKDVLHELDMEETIPYATTLLNIANAYRAAGKLEDSLTAYTHVFEIYDQQLDSSDFRYASLWNNLSLLYQEIGDFNRAIVSLEKALEIVVLYPEARIELATTHTNLAASMLKTERWQEAEKHLDIAFSIFEADEQKDYHYSAALSTMGELKFRQGEYVIASDYTQRAMKELDSHVGKTEMYWRLSDNLDKIEKKLKEEIDQEKDAEKKLQEKTERMKESESSQKNQKLEIKNGLQLARAFYEEHKDELQHIAGDAWNRLAVGLVGEGSECFGFDDAMSWDHDFGPGFCIWLTDEDYDAIGEKLTNYYNTLPKKIEKTQDYDTEPGILHVERQDMKQAAGRVGVMKTSDFYIKLLGTSQIPLTEEQWKTIPEEMLATAVNGKVFRDPLGQFSEIRNYLASYYTEEVRCTRLAQELGLMAQRGQYNYKRMMKRHEYVTADIMLASFMEHTMKAVYLLNRTYAPYGKWLHKGMQNLKVLPEIMDILNAIHDMVKDDSNTEIHEGESQVTQTINIIAKLMIHELTQQKLVTIENSEETYLAAYAEKVFASGRKDGLVEEIVLLEWKAFDQVKNEGGRADCQDDWNTFHIMRKSQYMTWNMPMLLQYRQDFAKANERGWNLITEKYARMMESTAPDEYAALKDNLPEMTDHKKAIIEQIVEIQVGWMESFAESYPHMASNARVIHTSEDSMYGTSYETYLRGELGTYSQDMLGLYGGFIVALANEQKNLAYLIMEQTALLYGYESLQQAEKALL